MFGYICTVQKFMEQYIYGIDHGNGNIKTARTVFPCGFTKQQIKPAGIFAEDVISYKGNYYILNSNRFPYTVDKSKDENCFILTLFAFAKEIKKRVEESGVKWKDFKGFVGKDVVLAGGLPPAYYEKQEQSFRKYFVDNAKYGVDFTYNEKPFSFHIKDVRLYPQDYAAAIIFKEELISKYSTVYCVDIGDGTVDLLGLLEGIPDKNVIVSRELGMARLREKIIDDVINDYAYTLDSKIIEDVLTPGKETVLDYEITEKIRRHTREWTMQIVNVLHAKVPDFRIAPTIFTGGGSNLLKPYLLDSGFFGKAEFISEINANAVGYEELAKIELSQEV